MNLTGKSTMPVREESKYAFCWAIRNSRVVVEEANVRCAWCRLPTVAGVTYKVFGGDRTLVTLFG